MRQLSNRGKILYCDGICNKGCPELAYLSFGLIGLLIFGFAVKQDPASPPQIQHPELFSQILELQIPPVDTVTLSPETIVQACTGKLQEGRRLPDETLVEIYVRRGVALSWLRRFEEAKKDFEEAIKLHPGDKRAMYFRACTLNHAGKKDESLKGFEELTNDLFHPQWHKSASLVSDTSLAGVG